MVQLPANDIAPVADGARDQPAGPATRPDRRAAVIYDAFISYSHAKDKAIANALQSVVQKLGKPWYRRRALRLFRDDTSLSATPHLWPSIEQALGRSRFLILLASPEAAGSHWVGQEIACWLDHNTADTVLIALTDGELDWEQTVGDFRWSEATPLPTILKGRFADEPRWIDLRPYRDANAAKGSEFMGLAADFAAAIRGIPKEDLLSEEVRQQRRARTLAWTAATALFALLVAAGWEWNQARLQRNEAQLQRDIALSRLVATQSQTHLREERLDLALLLALESGNVLTEGAATIPNTFEMRSSLLTALTHGSAPITAYLRGGNLFAFSPDGKSLASARADRIIVWDVKTRQPVGRPMASHGDAVFGIAFSPDGKTLASSSRSDHNLILWGLDTREPVGPAITAHDGAAVSVAFSPDGRTLATGGPGTILFWDLQTRQPTGPTLPGHGSNVVSLAFSPDGLTLASGSWDGTVILWDVTTRKPLGPPLTASLGQVESVTFSPDGKILASGGGGGILLWDVAGRRAIGPPMQHSGGVKSVAFGPDGKLLASGSGGTAGTIILWSVEKREPIAPPLLGHMRWIDRVAFSPDGRTLASSGGDEVILLWDLASLHRLGTTLPGYAGPANPVAFSRGGAVVASGICLERDAREQDCVQGGIQLWDLASRKQLRTLPTGCRGMPSGLVFPDNGTTLLSVGCTESDRSKSDCKGIGVQIWNVGVGRSELHCISDDRKLSKTALSPNGEIVAAGSCDESGFDAACEIRLWNIQTGRQVAAPLVAPLGMLSSLAFSPDGQTLASSSSHGIVLWDLQTGRPRGRPNPGGDIAFTMDGKISAVSASPDSQLRTIITLRDTATSQPIGELTAAEDEVILEMAFSPDGAVLATSVRNTADNVSSVILFDVSRREQLGAPLRWRGRALLFSPDGKTLLAGSDDRGVVAWNVDLESWRTQACAVANRNITYEEWRQSLGEVPYQATCPTFAIDPNMVESGRKRARAGDIEGAVIIFKRVLELDPTQKFDPRKEAIKFSVEQLVGNGRFLAVSGDLEGAMTSFRAAKRLDRDLTLDPSAEARKLAAPELISAGEKLAQQGSIMEAIAQFARAQEFDPALEATAAAWETLCWNGSLRGHAADVMAACDEALTREPDNGGFHTARGLAKAKIGHFEEAILDFQAFLSWAQSQRQTHGGWSMRPWLEAQSLRHEKWIGALRTGQDPFTPEELQKLKEEYPSEFRPQ